VNVPHVLTAESLRLPGVGHGFFTRIGGVSRGVYASLNGGVGSRDSHEAVAENRSRAAVALGVAPERLAVPYQIPLIMFVSERGTLGEFNYGQALVCRTMRPVLDSLAMEHHTATRLDEFEFIVDRSIKQAITTQAPVALILSPLLTGGKVFDK